MQRNVWGYGGERAAAQQVHIAVSRLVLAPLAEQPRLSWMTMRQPGRAYHEGSLGAMRPALVLLCYLYGSSSRTTKKRVIAASRLLFSGSALRNGVVHGPSESESERQNEIRRG
jgi:hypothetical protein